jgi:hypothetical protein
MPFESIYVLEKDLTVLEEGGFNEFPFAVPRYQVIYREVYGRGRGTMMLPQVRTLNRLGKDYMEMSNKWVNPPKEVLDSFDGTVDVTPGALNYVTEVSHGVNMPRLGTEAGRQAPFVVAPKREQKRIADKLDTILTRVDAVNIRLARVAPLLKRFRQSVLAAATEGRLTEDGRTAQGLKQLTETTLQAICMPDRVIHTASSSWAMQYQMAHHACVRATSAGFFLSLKE